MTFALRAAEVAMKHGARRVLDGSKIRQLREAAGLKPTELAAAIGCSEGHLRRLEKGIHRNPGLELIANLMDALRCGFDDLMS